MPRRPHVLLVAPQRRDLDAVARLGLDRRFRVSLVGDDLDRERTVTPRRLLAEACLLRPDGVVGTKDRSALLAAIVAERLGLPGPSPGAVLACQHKPRSRELQRRVAPEATPRFALVGSGPPLPFPFFVKPAVARLSEGARRVADSESFRQLDRTPLAAYAQSVAALARLAGESPQDLDALIAEELLEGRQLTLEGYVHRGRVTIVGATDSVDYPGTRSFERFEYPSALSAQRFEELERLAQRLVPAHGLDDAFFNLELVLPQQAGRGGDRGGPAVVELNARLASQFAPLVEACHGRSTYEALFELACGRDPGWDVRAAPSGVAVSYVLRVFEDALVEATPEPEPGLELLVRPGLPLSRQGPNDDASFRLAIFSEWGESRERALARCQERAARLRQAFRLRPL